MPAAAADLPDTTRTPGRRATDGVLPALLRLWIARRRTRDALADLHDDQIREAGLDRDEVRAEARKPFWRS